MERLLHGYHIGMLRYSTTTDQTTRWRRTEWMCRRELYVLLMVCLLFLFSLHFFRIVCSSSFVVLLNVFIINIYFAVVVVVFCLKVDCYLCGEATAKYQPSLACGRISIVVVFLSRSTHTQRIFAMLFLLYLFTSKQEKNKHHILLVLYNVCIRCECPM